VANRSNEEHDVAETKALKCFAFIDVIRVATGSGIGARVGNSDRLQGLAIPKRWRNPWEIPRCQAPVWNPTRAQRDRETSHHKLLVALRSLTKLHPPTPALDFEDNTCKPPISLLFICALEPPSSLTLCLAIAQSYVNDDDPHDVASIRRSDLLLPKLRYQHTDSLRIVSRVPEANRGSTSPSSPVKF
jgi:hypothetical protein